MLRLTLAIALLVTSVACERPEVTVWTFRTDRPWYLPGDSQALTPVVDGETVFVCGGYFWEDQSAIHALSRSDGRLLWKQSVDYCESAPWFVAGTLVVHSDGGPDDVCALQGFDPKTGIVRWRHEFAREQVVRIARCSIFDAVAGQSIVFAFDDDGVVHALDPARGTITRFTFPPDRQEQRLWMTASGSTVWFGYGTHVWRWADGRPQPEHATALSEDAEPSGYAATNGTLLFLGGGDPAQLRAFDLTTGEVRWRQALPEILSMTADSEGLYVNIWRRRYELIALDMKTGQERWTARAGGFHSPAKKNGRLYANGEFSVFVADPATGRIVRSIAAEDEVTTTPVVVGDLMIFGTINGAWHAVRVDVQER